jgi:Tol biopolymer transport system component
LEVLLWLLAGCVAGNGTVTAAFANERLRPGAELDPAGIPFKIVYESLRKTDDGENWELILINADGSDAVNLTRTSAVSEMYPHAAPDGTKICFVADEGSRRRKVRSVYFMNVDGTDRVKVAHNARQPCWSPDGRTIAYLKGEYERYTTRDFGTQGVFFYDVATGEHTRHPNERLRHLYNICWSPDGRWFVATVHGGLGFDHAVLAFEKEGTEVFDLTDFKVTGCRPDLNPDGTMITWGKTDWDLFVGAIDLTGAAPRVDNVRRIVKCDKQHEVYHTDFSPDGRYIAFSYGPKAHEQVGEKAPGWNVCITDLEGHWVQVTSDGKHNKEPDWVPVRPPGR